MTRYDFFISWTGEYGRQLAEEIHVAIDEITKANEPHTKAINCFVSSVSIGNGKDWRRALRNALTRSARGLVLVTQDILHSDWLAHEAGALSSRENFFLLVDTPLSLLPMPLRDYQCHSLTNDSLATILRELADSKGATIQPNTLTRLYSRIGRIRAQFAGTFVTDNDEKWKGKIERPLIISQQSESPFDIAETLKVARKRAVLVAQNHGFMTNPDTEGRIWPIVKDALIRGVQVDIVAMNSETRPARLAASPEPPVDAAVLWAHYMNAGEFFRHLKVCWNTLNSWKERAEEGKLHNLHIYRAYFTPLTVTAIDPNEANGFIVLSPRPPREANQSRPQIVLFKRSCPSSFEYYWQAIANSFDNDGWLEI